MDLNKLKEAAFNFAINVFEGKSRNLNNDVPEAVKILYLLLNQDEDVEQEKTTSSWNWTPPGF